jgi:hypothetical protein
MSKDYYLPDEAYRRLVNELAQLRLSLGGHPTIEDAIKFALGEVGGIWPASIKPAKQIERGTPKIEPIDDRRIGSGVGFLEVDEDFKK